MMLTKVLYSNVIMLVLPNDLMIWLYMPDADTCQCRTLYRSIKHQCLRKMFHHVIFICTHYTPLTNLELKYWFQIVFPSWVIFPHLCVNSATLFHLICPQWTVFCLWCSQPIVCWLHQGLECMGWSDLTELQRRQHILNWIEDYHVQLKGASLEGILKCEVIFLCEFTLKLVYLF